MVRQVARHVVPNITTGLRFWRMLKGTYTPEYLVPTLKHVDGSVAIWAPISQYSTRPIITLKGQITASDYVDISGKQARPLVQIFPNNEAIFQNNSPPPHTARE
jgi:hypothetical protein